MRATLFGRFIPMQFRLELNQFIEHYAKRCIHEFLYIVRLNSVDFDRCCVYSWIRIARCTLLNFQETIMCQASKYLAWNLERLGNKHIFLILVVDVIIGYIF